MKLPLLDIWRADDIPRMSRPAFLLELRHFMIWGVVVGAVEGNIAGIVVKKTFAASDTLVAAVWAAPVVANTLNIFWSALIRGRRRIPLTLLLACGVLVCTASVSLIPARAPWAGWIFAAQLGLTHFFLSGLTTLRASVWHANYPTSLRGRITGRLQRLRLALMLASGASISAIFDRHAEYYRYVYPMVALIGCLSLFPVMRLRVRGEAAEQRRLRERIAAGHRAANVWHNLVEAAHILRSDRRYALYMAAQFLLGSANFFSEPVLLNTLSGELRFGYFTSSLFMLQIPVAVNLLSISAWGRLFDRDGVVRFRVLNSALWVVAQSCLFIAMICLQYVGKTGFWLYAGLGVLAVSRMVTGAAQGGGAIAWNLGHLHFAGADQRDLYMGLHVALTGLRGLIMPLVASWVNDWIGGFSFLVSVCLAVGAHSLFHQIARRDRSHRDPTVHEISAEPNITVRDT